MPPSEWKLYSLEKARKILIFAADYYFSELEVCMQHIVLSVHAQVLEVASMSRGWGCAVPDTVDFSGLQPTHHRAWWLCLQENKVKKGQKGAWQWEVRETDLWAPNSVKEGRKCSRLVPEPGFLHSPLMIMVELVGISWRTASCEEPRLEQMTLKGCSLWGRSHAGAGEKCKEEGSAERSCSGLITTPIPTPPCATWRLGWVEELRMKEWSWTYEKGVSRWNCLFKNVFVSYYSNLF